MLYHEAAGPILTASMAEYQMVELFNQQENPNDEDFALTPRLESHENGWHPNLFDLKAKVVAGSNGEVITITSTVKLVGRDDLAPEQELPGYALKYVLQGGKMRISMEAVTASPSIKWVRFILPVVATSREKVIRASAQKYGITKAAGTLWIESNTPISVRKSKRGRVFNMVPGVAAVPFVMEMPDGASPLFTCDISFAESAVVHPTAKY